MQPRETSKAVSATRTFPIRLRYLVIGGVLLLLGVEFVPRARAAWQIHGLATAFADYALCMAGPTGPTLLRDNAQEFWRVVRRRLVFTPADSRPFNDCARHVEALTGSEVARRAHEARAREFVEFGGDAADRASKGQQGELALPNLAVSTHPLAELARLARPFVKEGYTTLVQPSTSAKEAAHPTELPLPIVGQGLPAVRSLYRAVKPLEQGRFLLALGTEGKLSVYDSQDGGVNWRQSSIQDPRVTEAAGRCFGEDQRLSFSVGLTEHRDSLKVASMADGGLLYTAELPRGLVRVLSIACDDAGLVAALAAKSSARNPNRGQSEVELYVCPRSAPCRAMPKPSLGQGLTLKSPMDVARVAGTTVLAVSRHGIVRTTSSRDDGASWAPFVVAFDAQAYPNLRVQTAVPSRLLTLGRRVVLSGGAPKPGMTYPVLASDDYGASWRTPLPVPLARNVN